MSFFGVVIISLTLGFLGSLGSFGQQMSTMGEMADLMEVLTSDPDIPWEL